jgi:hypothetical protein
MKKAACGGGTKMIKVYSKYFRTRQAEVEVALSVR